MLYSTDNIKNSVMFELSERLRSAGWNVLWHASQVTDTHTSGLSTPLGTISIVDEIPAYPTEISGLSVEEAAPHQICVPLLAVSVSGREEDRIVGLGHADYFYRREVIIDGFARNGFEHTRLADFLEDWLKGDLRTSIPIHRFDTDSSGATLLDPALVIWSSVSRREMATEVPHVRYYIGATFSIQYTE